MYNIYYEIDIPLTLAMARFLTFVGLFLLLLSGVHGLATTIRRKGNVLQYVITRLYLLPALALFGYYWEMLYTYRIDALASRNDLIFVNVCVGLLVFAVSVSNAYLTAYAHNGQKETVKQPQFRPQEQE